MGGLTTLPAPERVLTEFAGILTPFQMKAAVLHVTQNMAWRQIAMELGVSYQTVWMWQRKPAFVQLCAALIGQQYAVPSPDSLTYTPTADTMRNRFLDEAAEMQERLLAILETSGDPKLQAAIAQDWLDRANLGSPKQVQGANTLSLTLTDAAIERLLRRSNEIALNG